MLYDDVFRVRPVVVPSQCDKLPQHYEGRRREGKNRVLFWHVVTPLMLITLTKFRREEMTRTVLCGATPYAPQCWRRVLEDTSNECTSDDVWLLAFHKCINAKQQGTELHTARSRCMQSQTARTETYHYLGEVPTRLGSNRELHRFLEICSNSLACRSKDRGYTMMCYNKNDYSNN